MTKTKKIIIAAATVTVMLAAIIWGVLTMNANKPGADTSPSATDITVSPSATEVLLPSTSPAPADQQGTVRKIKVEAADSLLNTYTRSQPVTVAFTANIPSDKDLEITYTIINTLNQKKVTGTVTLFQGYDTAAARVTDLGLGHYNLYIKPGNWTAEPISQYFAIVHDLSEQKHTQTPFAIDHASSWHIKANYQERYAQLLKLMGVDTVRERINLNNVYSNGNYNFKTYDKAFQILKDAGFDISVAFHDSPNAFKTNKSKTMSQDLIALYQFTKDMVDHFGSQIKTWELWNEQDVIYFANDTPDEYAAFMKTMAIAMNDSSAKPVKALGSFARKPDFSIYGDWMMQNDVMSYVDMYNYHTYIFPGSATVPELDMQINRQHVDYAHQCAGDIAIWQTETGTIMNGGTQALTKEQEYQAARYAAVSSIQCYSLGVDKTFQFLMPSYGEKGASFGFYSNDHTPMPAFVAYTTMINMLGNAELVGKVNSDYANGFLVKNTGKEVLMLWNDKPYVKNVSIPSEQPLTVTDMNGGETVLNPENGKVKVPVGQYPVYVTCSLSFDKAIYSSFTVNASKPTVKTLTEQQKMVIKPVFDASNAPFFPKTENAATDGEAIKTGYQVKAGSRTSFRVEVYNFGSQTVKGTLKLSVDGGWQLDKTSVSVEVKPMEKTVLTFTLSGGKADSSLSALSIECTLPGGETSISVAKITGVK